MTSLEGKQSDRWKMLHGFYELSDGNEGSMLNTDYVYEVLGFTHENGDAVFDFLEGEGLLERVTFDSSEITHAGVLEVEKALQHPNESTQHFPPWIINIVNSPNTQFVNGDGNTLLLGGGISNSDLADKLEAFLRRVDEVIPESGLRLITAIREEDSSKGELVSETEQLANAGPVWKKALLDFTVQFSAAMASNMAFQSIKFGM